MYYTLYIHKIINMQIGSTDWKILDNCLYVITEAADCYMKKQHSSCCSLWRQKRLLFSFSQFCWIIQRVLKTQLQLKLFTVSFTSSWCTKTQEVNEWKGRLLQESKGLWVRRYTFYICSYSFYVNYSSRLHCQYEHTWPWFTNVHTYA